MKLDCLTSDKNAVPWNLTRLALMALAVSGLGAAPNSNLGRNGAVPADSLPGPILSAEPAGVLPQGLTILYPENDTLFPPEIAPPTIRWQDDSPAADTWLVSIMFSRDPRRMTFIASQPEWMPAAADWEIIKQRSLEKPACITIRGTTRAAPRRILSGSQVDIRTSKDEVGAPIFYREVKLPLAEAGGDPLHLRWRLGSVSSPGPPPVVLGKLPVCGNCHSFSLDGKTLAMDVDYEGKGSYVIRRVALVKIEAQIALDLVCVREGNELIKTGDYDGAIGKYRAALAHNPKNVAARQRLGVLLFYTKGQPAEGMKHLAAAFALAPANLYCQYDWGMALLHQGQVAEAVPCLAEALRLMSDHTNVTSEYNPFDTLHKLGLMLLPRHRRNRLMNPEPELEYALGLALFLKGDYEPSVAHLRRAATGSQSARFPEFPYQLALALALQGKVDEAVPFYLAGRQQKPELDTALVLADLIGAGCANEELFQQRIGLARKELQTGIQAGRSAASSRAQK